MSPLGVVGLWQLGSALGVISDRTLPAPSLVFDAGLDLARSGQLQDALTISGGRVLYGLLLGGILGIALGAFVGSSRIGEAIVDPPLQMLRALPHLALIPLFIIWFGIGEESKVLLVALGAFFPLYLNTASAIRHQDTQLAETAKVLGFRTVQRFSIVLLPGAAPQILVGLRQALAVAWLTLIVAEQLNADAGIGFLINNARDTLNMEVIVFGLVVYALLGIGTDGVVRLLERRTLRYRADAR